MLVQWLPGTRQGKLQKHQAFEAEVQANSGAIVKLDETGNLMISEGHFASETIRVSWGPPGVMACLCLAGGWVWVNAYPYVWVPEDTCMMPPYPAAALGSGASTDQAFLLGPLGR